MRLLDMKTNVIKYMVPPPNLIHTVSVLLSRKRYPKRNLNAKENGIYKGRSAGYLLWVVSGARWASAIIWWEVGVVASS